MDRRSIRVVPDDDPQFEAAHDFEVFYAEHRDSLEHWYMRRWRFLPADAADVAQEALAGLARRWPALRSDEHRRRSYYRICRNKGVDFVRAQGRRIAPDVSLDDRAVDIAADRAVSDPGVIVAGGSDSERVWEAVDRLPAARRDAVVGRVVLSLSYEEIAEASGRSECTVRQDFSRGLSMLRQGLAALVGAMTGVALRVRRTAPSSAVAAMSLASQATFLGLVLTAPLPVLPREASMIDAARRLPAVAVLSLPGLSGGGAPTLVSDALSVVRPLTDEAPGGWRRRPHRRPTVTVHPPNLCIKKKGCGIGERITVHVLGQEQGVTQSVAELCWAFPTEAEPYVTCRKGESPP